MDGHVQEEQPLRKIHVLKTVEMDWIMAPTIAMMEIKFPETVVMLLATWNLAGLVDTAQFLSLTIASKAAGHK